MTKTETPLAAEDVARFLRDHPEFFEGHADLLASIRVSHPLRGRAISLQERQLEVLREIGDAVSSSLDLEEVLGEIVSGAVRLTGADGGSIMEYDTVEDCFRVRATAGGTEALTARLRDLRIARTTSPVGRAASDRT